MAFPGLITIVDCQRTYLVVGLPGDLLLTVPAISNPCDLPGMRHRYGGDRLKELQGRKELYTSCNCA